MPRYFWKSLRSRILLLAVLTFLFLFCTAFTFFAFLRSSQAATLSVAERHLVSVASGLARSYSERPESVPSLSNIELPPPPRPPVPRPEPVMPREDRPLPPPPPAPPNAQLSALTAQALRQEIGIEGGFFAPRANVLTGYAFPTHEGPGPAKEMPSRERPTIEQLARDAVATSSTKTTRFEGPHDAVLFVAVPIREKAASLPAKTYGAVWLMQRMPGITGGRNRQLLWGSLGFGGAALITALLTFFVTGEVSRGVNDVLGRLRVLEGGLFAERPPLASGSNLEEFDRVLRGIDALAASLGEKIQKERTLEVEMRHKERLSALGQFAAGIAHELRNPLATIRLRTQMSQRSLDHEGVARNSKVVLEEIDRLDTIIGRLLYFARPLHLHLRPVSLDELCCTAVEAWKERPAFTGIAFSCEADSAAVISCDRSRMLQVLDNLLENAVQSVESSSHGSVSLRATQADGFVEMEIRDNGPGFHAEALHQALNPFFTTKESGTGLGLSISFEIIQAHDGELTLSNHLEGGAVASVRLPSKVQQSILAGASAAENRDQHG